MLMNVSANLNATNVARLILPTFAVMTLISLSPGLLRYVKEWAAKVTPVLLTMTAPADCVWIVNA